MWLILGLVSALAILFIPVPSETFLWKAVNNSGHVPLFLVVSLLLLKLSQIVWRECGWWPIRHYAMAMGGVVLLALTTEALQSLSTIRHPQATDVLHDVAGAICGLGLALTYDCTVSGHWAWCRSVLGRSVVRGGVVAMIAISFWPVWEWAYAYWDRADRFPSLVAFSSYWEMKFVKAVDSELQMVSAPSGWPKPIGDTVGYVTFYPTKYPGIRIDEPFSDWRGYKSLQIEIYSDLPETQSLVVRIDDAHHNQEHSDRYNQTFRIMSGLNQIRIPVQDIRQAPASRHMDLGAIKTVLLFAVSPPQPFVLYIDNIRLE